MNKTRRRPRPPYPVRKAPFVVILIALLIGLAGIATGEPQRVLEQGIRVCLSCIGIG